MDCNEYQEKALTTAIYPEPGTYNGLAYAAMGLAGEAGEFAGKVSKLWRDKHGVIDEADRKFLGGELGDTAWFLAIAIREVGTDFVAILQENLDKLASRKERGVLQGSGDNR